jgi:2-amino-4-hydroxy-6-hydroxymethyldihydropteridine diphosphokinase
MSVAYIGLGSNLASAAGSPAATLAAAVERLASLGQVIARSSLYSTAPVGYANQPRFLNAVVGVETHLGPRALLVSLLRIEREFGRDRASAIANGPRTLDLDILLYGDLIVSESGLEIPHPRLAEREFALVPLNEIAPAALDPRSGAKVKELLEKLRAGLSLNSDQTTDEVVSIESVSWRSGSSRADAGSSDARPGVVVDSDHG